MSLETAIYTRLSGFSALTALVGGASNPRIYPNWMPQSTAKPAIAYARIFAERFSAFVQDSGVVRAMVRFDIFADTYDSALAVKEQLRAALQRFQVSSPTKVFDTYVENEIDLYETETELHHLVIDFEFNYVEA